MPQGDEVLYEFHRHGNVVKVSVIHVPTNTEISIVGAATAGEYALKMAALRKLQYVLNKDKR